MPEDEHPTDDRPEDERPEEDLETTADTDEVADDASTEEPADVDKPEPSDDTSDDDALDEEEVASAAPRTPPRLVDEARRIAEQQRPQHEPETAPVAVAAVEERHGLERRGLPITAQFVLLVVLMQLLFLMFLLIEPTPRWMLLLGAVAVALGTHGVLRSTWRAAFEGNTDATPYVFLPVMYVVGVPLLIEQNVRGEDVILAAFGAGAGFAAVLAAEVASVRRRARGYQAARFVATAATYFAGFALLSLTYVFELDLLPAMFAAGLITLLLSVELLHHGEVGPFETVIYAFVTGVVVAEVRWLLFFIEIDGYLAGLLLLLAFFFVTGMLYSHLTRKLNLAVAAEYLVIAVAGVAAVAFARVNDLA